MLRLCRALKRYSILWRNLAVDWAMGNGQCRDGMLP